MTEIRNSVSNAVEDAGEAFEELVPALLGFFARDAVAFLNDAGGVRQVAFHADDVVVGQIAERFFHIALDLRPLAFHDIHVHDMILLCRCDTGKSCAPAAPAASCPSLVSGCRSGQAGIGYAGIFRRDTV
jgi:hypothetical protein